MANMIARRWSLGVLRVTLDEAPETPAVTCEVVINEGPKRKVRLRRQFPIWSFGEVDPVGRSRVRELDLAVPSELVDDLADWVRGGADNRAVLWIHLVKPYGVLGAVPWEGMEAAIGIPVLRLPDVLPDQRPPRGSIDIAVCAAAQQHKGDLPLVEVASEIMDAADSLTEVPPTPYRTGPEPRATWEMDRSPPYYREVRVHFFVDQVTAEQLTGHFSRSRSERDLFTAQWAVHEWDPTREADLGTPAGRRPRGTARAENRWLAWIQDAARKQSFDVLHFVCHGYVTGQGDQGVLALPVSPAEADFQAASHVTATEVLNAAQTVGAFAVGFSSLHGNYSVSGMRLVADAVGANRAGPVFMYDHMHGDGNDLRYAYQMVLGYADQLVGGPILYGKLPGEPRFDFNRSSLFYVQPDLVMVNNDDGEGREGGQGYGVALWSPAVADIEEAFPSVTPTISEVGADARTAPPWASVLARYVDEKRSDLTPLRAAQRAGNLDQDGQAYMEGVEKALKHLNGVLTRYSEDTQ